MNVIDLTSRLIAQQSLTPFDANCQQLIREFLAPLGFQMIDVPRGRVSNLWAMRGDAKPLLVFAGHTDVVPAGDRNAWQSDPFTATITNNFLVGRGASDMKGALAAMLIATRLFIEKHENFAGSLGFLITSGEEGDEFLDGTPAVIDYLQQHHIAMDYCVVGEPSCDAVLGDTIKVGRRGSLTGYLTVKGKQGHVAYPHLANNPIPSAAALMHELTTTQWDRGNEFFPATSFQITNVNSGTGAGNVIPGDISLQFNFRYSTQVTHEQLQTHVENIIAKHCPQADLRWLHNGSPFLTNNSTLITALQNAITTVTQQTATLSTSGGTSDARFIAPTGCAVVEFGLRNDTIHQVNEKVAVRDLQQLVEIYRQLLRNVFQVG